MNKGKRIKTKLVVFDWNGTLLSDTRVCTNAVNEVLHFCGAKPISIQRYRNTITTPVEELYIVNGCDKKFLRAHKKEFVDVFHNAYEKEASKCRMRKGARDVLTWLKKHNIERVVVSNHTLDGLKSQFDRLALHDLISEVDGNSNRLTVVNTLNKLESVQKYIKKKNYKPKEVIILGDSLEETELAHELGIVSVAITDGFFATSRLRAVKPDYLISNLLELKKIVKL